jgi:hypothetical protein
MPRSAKHFKIHCSIQNHRKTLGVFDDDALLAMYVRVGILAVERFADRTGDSFLVSSLDLERVAGCRGVANARRKLGRLEASTRLTVCQEGAGYRLTLPNFARKQGFGSRNRVETVYTPTSAPTPTPTPKKKESPTAPGPSDSGQRNGIKGPKPNNFHGDQLAAIHRWARGKKYPLRTLNEALELFREWEPLKQKDRSPAQWGSAFKRICRESVEDGRIGKTEDGKPKAPAYDFWKGHDLDET